MSGVMMPILGYLKVTNFNEELDVCNGVANKTLKHILSHVCLSNKCNGFGCLLDARQGVGGG
jgi:hypothetical protein